MSGSRSGPVAVLVGAPGAGKTTVGRALAQRLGVEFVDTDLVVEEAAGKSVAYIFVDEGEAAFRAREAKAVLDCLSGVHGVLALGGGAVLDPATREALRGERVVWLVVGISDAARRVGLNAARPLLLGNVRGRLMSLLDQRTPLYAEVATVSVDTDGKEIADVVDEVLAAVTTSETGAS